MSKICFIKTCCEGFVSISACIGYLTAQWRIEKKKNDCNQNIYYQECIKGTTNAYSLCVLDLKTRQEIRTGAVMFPFVCLKKTDGRTDRRTPDKL